MGRYLEYLRSDEWKRKRALVILRCSDVCEMCHLWPVEEIHHKTYDRLYNERLDDLLGLCASCHEAEHDLEPETSERIIDPETEIRYLVVKLYDVLRRSRSGWVDWSYLASKQGIPCEMLMGLAHLPQWADLFVKSESAVKLTPKGLEFAAHCRTSRPGVVERKPGHLLNKDVGISFAWIPPVAFVMGSPPGETQRENDEAHFNVTLTQGFFIGIYPVTQAQWKKVMPRDQSHFQGDTLPVEKVSWLECDQFCKKLNEIDGSLYRLPTEAEWECACRAGTTTPFHFGDTLSLEQANYDASKVYGNGKKGTPRRSTTTAGSFPANAWGLFDMHGNVREWCSDWYGDYPSRHSTDHRGPKDGVKRVHRGGAWNQIPNRCRSAFRGCEEPGMRQKDLGFRICFTAE